MNEIQFLMYDDNEKVEVLVQDETIWATQKTIAELFDVDRTSISRHLKNIFETNELDEKVVSAEIAHTTQHGAMEGKTQTKAVAKKKAIDEYNEYNKHQKIVSDFDREIKKIQGEHK